MAFGQQSGPPASARQVQELSELVLRAGHTDFRDARGPLGLTQRQAAGKFTREEADELIARLEAELDAAAGDCGLEPAPAPTPRAAPVRAAPARREPVRVSGLDRVPAHVLAAELQRRGWVVMEP